MDAKVIGEVVLNLLKIVLLFLGKQMEKDQAKKTRREELLKEACDAFVANDVTRITATFARINRL